MATVRITKELTDDIARAAHSKFSDAINKAKDAKPEAIWGDAIYERIFGEYQATMESLPKEFFPYKTEIYVSNVDGIYIGMSFPLSAKRPFPPVVPSAMEHIASRTGDGRYNLSYDHAWLGLIEQARVWSGKTDALVQQQRTFVEGVRQVLSNFSTLAPALKEWPPLWELVPERVKLRHKEVVVKEKKDKPGLDENTLGRLTGAITAAKLGGL